MTEKRFTLTDIQAGVYEETFSYSERDTSHPAHGCQITKRRLCGGPSDGVDVVRVDNGRLAFEVLPTRGMGLWKAWCNGIEIGWNSPSTTGSSQSGASDTTGRPGMARGIRRIALPLWAGK
jgi:hypothetical protein